MTLPAADALCGLSIFLYRSMLSALAIRLLISVFCLNVYMTVYEKGAGTRSAPGFEKRSGRYSITSPRYSRGWKKLSFEKVTSVDVFSPFLRPEKAENTIGE